MTIQYVSLPLYSDSDYQYSVSLEGNAYVLRIYYNTRCKQWFFDLLRDDNTPIILSQALVALFPITLDYSLYPLTGFLFLEPKGQSIEKYREDPENLDKFFRLFWIWNDGQ